MRTLTKERKVIGGVDSVDCCGQVFIPRDANMDREEQNTCSKDTAQSEQIAALIRPMTVPRPSVQCWTLVSPTVTHGQACHELVILQTS